MNKQLMLVNEDGIVCENGLFLKTQKEVNAIFGDTYRLVLTDAEPNTHIHGKDVTKPSFDLFGLPPLTGDELIENSNSPLFPL